MMLAPFLIPKPYRQLSDAEALAKQREQAAKTGGGCRRDEPISKERIDEIRRQLAPQYRWDSRKRQLIPPPPLPPKPPAQYAPPPRPIELWTHFELVEVVRCLQADHKELQAHYKELYADFQHNLDVIQKLQKRIATLESILANLFAENPELTADQQEVLGDPLAELLAKPSHR